MKLEAGVRLGRYEIRSKIGAGGMGEVYRAFDPKIGREVAIKVLPPDLSTDKKCIARFEQEAQAAGALNHPNILAIYDVDTQDEVLYVVSELLAGEELRDQLNEGPIPLRKVIEYAQQIVGGLSAAHERGIVHRDLKPENLFITSDGRVKILDFGLAKLKPQNLVAGADSEASTRFPLTDPGVVMGTVGYMAPEQVRGQDADHRSDIFSFGVILYEMLVGHRPFAGQSAVEMMNAILKEEPPEITESNRQAPPQLERIVHRCLEKKPERRFHSAHDLGFALEALSTPSGSRLETAASSPVSTEKTARGKAQLFGNARLWMAIAAFAVLVLLASLPFTIAYFRRAPAQSFPMRFTIALPEKAQTFGPVISPDGRLLVFNTVVEGRSQLWLRPLGSFTMRPLPGTEGSVGFPFWSPDSLWIGFLVEDKLKKIDVASGTQQTLCAVLGSGGAFGGTWNREDAILFARSGIIYRVSATGGEPTPVPGLDQSREGMKHLWPSFLPDGRHFLYLATTMQQVASEIYLSSLDGQDPRRLLTADSQAVYVASAESTDSGTGSGYLVFVREGALLAQPFETSSLKLTGEPFRVADQVKASIRNNRGDFSVSDTGALIYDPSGTTENFQFTWFDRAGKLLGRIGKAGSFDYPVLSPDEKRAAVEQLDPKTGTPDIYVKDLVRDTSSRLTFDPAPDRSAVWSPDGSRIVWCSYRGGSYQLYQKLSSGAGEEKLLLQANNRIIPTDWSSDGRFILYSQLDPKTRKDDLWVLPLDGDRQPFPFLETPFDERDARFSPNARWIAYDSDESGQREVYVQAFPATGGKWPVSTKGGMNPRWRRDGKELFYASEHWFMSVEVKTGSTFEPGIPKLLFDPSTLRSHFGFGYSVTADGQRFLGVGREEETGASSLAVVVNWTAELKK